MVRCATWLEISGLSPGVEGEDAEREEQTGIDGMAVVLILTVPVQKRRHFAGERGRS